MRVYLVQHGEAKSKEEDPQRPLTDGGRADVMKVADLLKPLGLTVRGIWHSGKARAAQTAHLLAAAVAATEGVTQRDDLSPNDPVEPLRKAVESSEGDRMLVGHLPFMSKLASRLLSGDEKAPLVAFRQGGVVCLAREEKIWQVAWMVTPDLLGG